MDLDGVDVDNLSQDEILKLYNDILDNGDSTFTAATYFYDSSGGGSCYCISYATAQCYYSSGTSGYIINPSSKCK